MDTLCVTVNGEKTDAASCIKDGYLYLKQNWGENDVIELTFDLPVRKIYANTNVREDEGCVALMRVRLFTVLRELTMANVFRHFVYQERSKLRRNFAKKVY